MAQFNPEILSKYVGVLDRQRLQADFDMKKQILAQKVAQSASGGDLPAPLQLANEYQKRIQAGDIQGANLIMQFAKTQDKGLQVDSSGNFGQLPGYAEAIGGIGAVKKGMEQQAQKNVDVVMDPLISMGTQTAKNNADIAATIPQARAKSAAENSVESANLQGQLPNLEKVVTDLSSLGKKATYTRAGQAADSLRKETGGYFGFGSSSSDGSIARKEYISKVDNEVLPLLRQTFGAAFTAQEGQSLKNTLGDPNATPDEKDAVLRSFITQKKAQVESLGRQNQALGGQQPLSVTVRPSPEEALAELIRRGVIK